MALDNNQALASTTPQAITRNTPVPKFVLIALLITLPFVGGYVGYKLSSERTEDSLKEPLQTVLRSEISNAASSSERRVFSRAELIKNEQSLIKEFDIKTESITGKAPLYWAKDEKVTDTLVQYKDKGITILIGYNEGWGAPYYRLTPYDDKGDLVVYGQLNPCPAGCLSSGAMVTGRIRFHPAGSKKNLVESYTSVPFATCKEIRINSKVSGTDCFEDGSFGRRSLIIEGSQYTYEIDDACVTAYLDDEKDWGDACRAIAESIVIQ